MNRAGATLTTAAIAVAGAGIGATEVGAALKRSGAFEISSPGDATLSCDGGDTCQQRLQARVYADRPGLLPATGYTITVNGKVHRAKPEGRVCYNTARDKYCTLVVYAVRTVDEDRSRALVTGFVRFRSAKTRKQVSFKASFRYAATPSG